MDTEAPVGRAEMEMPGPRSDPLLPETQQGMVRKWWMELAAEDVESVLQKLTVYGALDLHGYAYHVLVPQAVVSGEEIAIAMYVAGKVNRLIEGYSHGEKPTADTWDDIARYATMARWVRKVGHWP